jgi:hypothetical protein
MAGRGGGVGVRSGGVGARARGATKIALSVTSCVLSSDAGMKKRALPEEGGRDGFVDVSVSSSPDVRRGLLGAAIGV